MENRGKPVRSKTHHASHRLPKISIILTGFGDRWPDCVYDIPGIYTFIGIYPQAISDRAFDRHYSCGKGDDGFWGRERAVRSIIARHRIGDSYFTINHNKGCAAALPDERVESFYERPAFGPLMKYSAIIRHSWFIDSYPKLYFHRTCYERTRRVVFARISGKQEWANASGKWRARRKSN